MAEIVVHKLQTPPSSLPNARAKGTVQGDICAFDYVLSGNLISGSGGYQTVASANIELNGAGPFPEQPGATAFALAIAACPGGSEVQNTDDSYGTTAAGAGTSAACPSGGQSYWEAYAMVEAYVLGSRCDYRGYNPSGNL